MKNILLLFALLFAGYTASAQCNASFTSSTAPATVTVTNTSTGSQNGVSYNWTWGDGTSDYTYQGSHTYTMDGAYEVCLMQIDSVNLCTAISCDSVFITGTGNGGGGGGSCVADFSFSQQGNNASFFNASSGSNLDYAWTFGDGATSTAMDPTHTYAVNGTYLVCLVVSNAQDSSCYDMLCDTLVIGNGNNPCMASFYWWPDSTGNQVVWMVNNSTGNGPLAYTWDFGDGTTSTQAYPSHTYANLGSYLVCLTITDNQGSCTSTYCDTVTVVARASGFTINVVDDPASVGIDEETTVSVNALYPNPATDNATVSLNSAESGSATLMLFDAVGKMVMDQQINIVPGDNNFQLKLNDLPQGMYIMAIQSEELNLSATERLIKH